MKKHALCEGVIAELEFPRPKPKVNRFPSARQQHANSGNWQIKQLG
jgi:hypothetical protein